MKVADGFCHICGTKLSPGVFLIFNKNGESLVIQLIIRRFVPDYTNVADNQVRGSYVILSGVLGIVCNVVLFILKLLIGIWVNSIAVVSDAFNNLSDLSSSCITIFGARLANRPPDKEHPHGHGRVEYIGALVVSFIILAVGLQLLRSSVEKIIEPEIVSFNLALMVVLLFSVGIKLWMFSYNKYIGEAVNSSMNRAVAYDSLNDAVATSAVAGGAVLGQYVDLPVDGILGVIISILVLYTGFGIARDSVDLLLGSSPDPKLVQEITAQILKGKSIKGVHDLDVHDYGPGRTLASVHAEVSDSADLVEVHAEIDEIERTIERELGVKIVIHMDPVEKGGTQN